MNKNIQFNIISFCEIIILFLNVLLKCFVFSVFCVSLILFYDRITKKHVTFSSNNEIQYYDIDISNSSDDLDISNDFDITDDFVITDDPNDINKYRTEKEKQKRKEKRKRYINGKKNFKILLKNQEENQKKLKEKQKFLLFENMYNNKFASLEDISKLKKYCETVIDNKNLIKNDHDNIYTEFSNYIDVIKNH
jgi:hypothetical protein